MRKLAGLVGLSLCLGLAPHPAAAAGFDGRWIADIPVQGRCNVISLMTMVVSGRDFSGQVQNNGDTDHFTGQVGADGLGNIVVDGKYGGAIRFKEDRFEATWGNGTCDRHAEGSRVPDDVQSAAMAQERKRRQAAYADLVQRAVAGDKAVDYAALRSESVFATNWAFYNGKATALLTQAAAAVKGKDCPQALDTLDQILKLDFTIDAAHALRSECLKDAGKADEARIESDIAEGLVHSLMDSGKGDTEKTAYVVHTHSEEMDILANRHIQIKTRQTQLRGADGRFYDVIHGVAVNTDPAIEVKPRDLYFDMTSFVTGRASKRAAEQVLRAQLQ